MKKLYADFLKSILETIHFLGEKEQYVASAESEKYESQFKQKVELVEQSYEQIKIKKAEDALFDFLGNEYADDKDVYLFLLHYIYGIVEDIKVEIKYMEYRLENGILNNDDVFMLLNLDMQIRAFSWKNNIEIPFEKQWGINCVLGEMLKERIGFTCEKIPVSDRDREVVVVVASQILNDRHAPTRLVLDTCYRMKKLLNKEVLVVNFAQYSDRQKLQDAGVVVCNISNLCEKYNGPNDYEYKGILIPMYQVAVNDGNLDEIKSVLEFIYSLRPFCIWNISTLPAMLPTLRQITTNIYTSCTMGYEPVKTDAFYNYFSNVDEMSIKNRVFLGRQGTNIFDYVFIRERQEINTDIRKSDVGIPEDSFVICVAGNRLETDINDMYLKIIDTIMESNQHVHFMLIGSVSEKFVENSTKKSHNCSRIHFLGYRQDFLECMTLMDLYVNSFGLGGGAAGCNALFLSKPIVTLNEGDIYSFVGEEFAVENMEEYIPLINRYIHDQDFYKSQSKIAKERYENLVANDEKVATVMKEILDRIDYEN